MRVNGYKCDACCTVNNGEEALKGWFAVYDFRKGVASDEQHFCSLHCLGDWVQKQLGIINPKPVEIRNSVDPDMAIDPVNPNHLAATEIKVTDGDRKFWRDN